MSAPERPSSDVEELGYFAGLERRLVALGNLEDDLRRMADRG